MTIATDAVTPPRVLLTGISGFLGGHLALALLRFGYRVRGSVRTVQAQEKVRQSLVAAGADVARLELCVLDLLADDGWPEAMAGCRYLLHTASPFVLDMPSNPDILLRPAIEGTQRALGAALEAGVERIVLTSSMAAVAYGYEAERVTPFTASDWSRAMPNAYIESKTRAEQVAWIMMRAAGRAEDLVSINPSMILGPLWNDDPGTSALMVQRLLSGRVPALPRLPLTLVDVRDVVQAHCLALTHAQVGGQRLLMGQQAYLLPEIAAILRDAFPHHRVPQRMVPDWLLRLAAPLSRNARAVVGELGKRKVLDSGPVEQMLGRRLMPARQSILDTAASLRERGLLPGV